MTIVVGPARIRGPGRVDAGLVEVALACIDEELAVFDDQVVTVRSLWCRAVRAACDGDTGPTVLVVPTAWAAARVEFVEEMLRTTCSRVVVRRRAAVLLDSADAVVEIDPDCVVVRRCTDEQVVIPRVSRGDLVADSVIAAVHDATTVTVDVADGVAGAKVLAHVLARRLRRSRVEVSVTDDDDLRAAASASRHDAASRGGPRRRATVLLAATAAVPVAILAGAAMATGGGSRGDAESTWIVEGRVAVEVPASWTVRRVTEGAGSARVQVISPSGEDSIHVTAARVEEGESIESTADALREALDRQSKGVFVNFIGDGSAAGRSAVTYTENRSAGPVDWVVVLDRGMRIAVGCQHPLARRGAVSACERAVHSARSVP